MRKTSQLACIALLLITPGACDQQSSKEFSGEKVGVFRSVHGETGQVSFGAKFTSPPQVTLNAVGGKDAAARESTIITETTTTSFRWKNAGTSQESDGDVRWKAR